MYSLLYYKRLARPQYRRELLLKREKLLNISGWCCRTENDMCRRFELLYHIPSQADEAGS